MDRNQMLNEHLQTIYILEDVNKALGQLKSKKNDIANALKSGNVLKVNKSFESLPNISPKEAEKYALKKMKKEYKDSEKIVNSKMKKAPEDIKKAVTAMRASLVKMRDETEDPELKNTIEKRLERMDAMLNKAGSMFVSGGFNLSLLAFIISLFIGGSFATIIFTISIHSIIFGIVLYMVAFLIRVFVEAKKAGDKVIS